MALDSFPHFPPRYSQGRRRPDVPSLCSRIRAGGMRGCAFGKVGENPSDWMPMQEMAFPFPAFARSSEAASMADVNGDVPLHFAAIHGHPMAAYRCGRRV